MRRKSLSLLCLRLKVCYFGSIQHHLRTTLIEVFQGGGVGERSGSTFHSLRIQDTRAMHILTFVERSQPKTSREHYAKCTCSGRTFCRRIRQWTHFLSESSNTSWQVRHFGRFSNLLAGALFIMIVPSFGAALKRSWLKHSKMRSLHIF